MKRVKCCDAEWVVDSSSVLSVLGTRTALVTCLWGNIADCCKCCCGISVWLEPLCLNVGKKLSAGDRLVPWWMGCAHVNSSVLLQLCSEQHLSVHHLLRTSVPSMQVSPGGGLPQNSSCKTGSTKAAGQCAGCMWLWCSWLHGMRKGKGVRGSV